MTTVLIQICVVPEVHLIHFVSTNYIKHFTAFNNFHRYDLVLHFKLNLVYNKLAEILTDYMI